MITGPDSRTLIWKVPWSLSHSWENQRGINELIPGEETTSKMSLVSSASQGRLRDALGPPGLLPPFLLHVTNFPFQPMVTRSSPTVERSGDTHGGKQSKACSHRMELTVSVSHRIIHSSSIPCCFPRLSALSASLV